MHEDEHENDLEVLNKISSILQPLSHERRSRVIRSLLTLLGIAEQAPANHPHTSILTSSPERHVPFSQDLTLQPKQFLLEKQPRTDVERVACLAFYLTHYRDTPYFKTVDLSKLNTEAAQPKLSNPNYATRNAVTYGYLAQATKGQRQLSAAGEQFVNALPDRDSARMLMANIKKRRRARKKNKSNPYKKGN